MMILMMVNNDDIEGYGSFEPMFWFFVVLWTLLGLIIFGKLF
jgi:hypothetical protein